MTAALPVAEKIRTRYRAERQRFSEAQYVLRPFERLRVQAEALGDYLNGDDSGVDVACGTGYLSAHVQEMYGVRQCGVDVRAFRKAQIRFRLFDGTSVPFPDKSFDLVVLSEVLHHSHDVESRAAAPSCSRTCPDGRVDKLILYLHVRIFARRYDYPFKAASIRVLPARLVVCDATEAPC